MTPDDLTSSVKTLLRATTVGDLYVIRHTQRCPSCDEYWVWDCVAPQAAIDLEPDPIKQGMSNLCGICEAMRRVHLVDRLARYMSQPATRYVAWSDEDERRAWGKLRHYASAYKARIVSGALQVTTHDARTATLEDGRVHELRDDKRSELQRIFGRENGVQSIVLTMKEAQSLGLPVRMDMAAMERPALAAARASKPKQGQGWQG